MTSCRNHVMQGSRLDPRYAHFHRTQQFRNLFEPIRTKPMYIFHCLINGIHSFLPCGVSRFSPGVTIQHHQPLLRYRRTHSRRLSHKGKINPTELRKHALNPATSRVLLFRGCQEYQITRQTPGCQFNKNRQHRDNTSPRVITSQTEQLSLLHNRRKRITVPSPARTHGIQVCIE